MSKYLEITFTAADILNEDEWIPAGEYNPHNVCPYLLHDHGFPLAVVFADCLQDAIDIAADYGKLERYKLYPEDVVEYENEGFDIDYLGNKCEPFDIESLGAIELPNPKRLGFIEAFDARGNR